VLIYWQYGIVEFNVPLDTWFTGGVVAVRGKKPAVAEAADVVYQPGDVEEGMVNPDVTKARIALEERQMMMEENLKMKEIQMIKVHWKRELE